MTLEHEISEALKDLNPAERQVAEQRIRRMLVRRAAIARFPTPAHLCQFLRPGFVQTPALDALDEAMMAADAGGQLRHIINMPPQEGKTTRIQDAALWFLLRDPTRRIVFASYEQGIAQESGLAIRQFIENHGSGYKGQQNLAPDHEDVLGLMLDPARGSASSWSLIDVPGRKRPGGVVSVGIGSALTGRPADVIVIDDPLKDAAQADSPTYRRRVINWVQSVAMTRLSGRAIVIVIQTRWHEDDLTGYLMKIDKMDTTPEWTRLSIPAQAMENDPLGRKPGEWLVSTRGRTVAEWEQKRRDSGSGRWWFAMYQQEPAPLEGGIFKASWFERDRLPVKPEMKYVITVVDPADNEGEGDEAGIVTGGIIAGRDEPGEEQHYAVLADDSGHYTIAGWARRAIFAALKHGSAGIHYEQSLSGLRRALRDEWKLLRVQARVLHEKFGQWSRFGEGWPEIPSALAIGDAIEELSQPEDTRADREELKKHLVEMWPYVPNIRATLDTGVPVHSFPAKGSKTLRAEFVAPLYENRRVHHVGHMPTAERQMSTWQSTQDSPDRMDAFVHLLTKLSTMAAPKIDRPQGQVPTRSYTAAGQGIQRSTATRR